MPRPVLKAKSVFTEVIFLRVDPVMKAQIKTLAYNRGKYMVEFLREIIADYLEQNND